MKVIEKKSELTAYLSKQYDLLVSEGFFDKTISCSTDENEINASKVKAFIWNVFEVRGGHSKAIRLVDRETIDSSICKNVSNKESFIQSIVEQCKFIKE